MGDDAWGRHNKTLPPFHTPIKTVFMNNIRLCVWLVDKFYNFCEAELFQASILFYNKKYEIH